MANLFIFIPKDAPFEDDAVDPVEVYEDGQIHRFDSLDSAQVAAANRIINAGAGFNVGTLVNSLSGREVEMQATATHIQWRYVGAASWTNLIALSELQGPAGADGNTVLSGTGAPDSGTGENGDFYFDTASTTIYGPKAAGAWPSGVLLLGDDGLDGDDVSLQVTATHIQWRLGTEAWQDLIALSELVGPTPAIEIGTVTTGAPGSSASVANSGTSTAAVLNFSIPKGDGIQIDVSGPFSGRSAYDGEVAGFGYASTDGADGLGGVDVLYIRVGASGWSDPVGVQGPQGETGDAISLDGFVPYVTIVTTSGDLIPGASVQFTGTSEAVLALDATTAELGDLYPLGNAGTANVQIDPGGLGGHIAIGSMSAGDRLTLEPGDFCTLVCSSLTGPTYTLHAA